MKNFFSFIIVWDRLLSLDDDVKYMYFRRQVDGTANNKTFYSISHRCNLYHSFIRSFVHSFIRSFIHSFIHSYVCRPSSSGCFCAAYASVSPFIPAPLQALLANQHSIRYPKWRVLCPNFLNDNGFSPLSTNNICEHQYKKGAY